MTMSNGHFQTTVTWGAQSDEVANDIGRVLVDVVATWINVMHVKAATAWTAFSPAVLANFITVVNCLPDVFPVAPVLQTCSTSPVRPVLSSHVLNGAITRTVFASLFCLRRESVKELAAVGTSNLFVGPNPTGVGAFCGTVLDFRSALVKTFAAERAIDICHCRPAPRLMTGTGAKGVLGFFARSAGLALKRFATMIALYGFCLADSVNRALARTVVNVSLIRFEFFRTLEASLDHN